MFFCFFVFCIHELKNPFHFEHTAKRESSGKASHLCFYTLCIYHVYGNINSPQKRLMVILLRSLYTKKADATLSFFAFMVYSKVYSLGRK